MVRRAARVSTLQPPSTYGNLPEVKVPVPSPPPKPIAVIPSALSALPIGSSLNRYLVTLAGWGDKGVGGRACSIRMGGGGMAMRAPRRGSLVGGMVCGVVVKFADAQGWSLGLGG